jgi:sulfate-transporting ATPase
MLEVIRFAILGASAGAILAMLALGVNVVFRASRVINFSHAAIAISAAYLYKDFLDFAPAPVALVLAIIVGMLIGGLTDLAVMRPLRSASALTKAIATIGVLLTLQALLNLRYGFNPVIVPSWLPTDLVRIGEIPVGMDRIINVGICILLTTGLYFFYKKSSFGIASTALSVNDRSLAALGKWSPRSVSLINWMIAGGLAGLAGVMIAPITSLSPALSAILLVPILSTALIGGLSSFWLTLIGGVLLGIAQAEIAWLNIAPGLSTAIPFAVIVILLAIRGSSLPARGESTDRLPRLGSGRIPVIPIAVAFVITFILVQWVLPVSWVTAVTTGLVSAVILLSLVVVTGYAGQLSLASFALAGVAALVAAQLVAGLGWSFLPAAIVGVLATVPVGLLVGLPAVRTRGTSLAVVTLGLAVSFQSLILDNPKISGGINGLTLVNPVIFGLDINAVFFPRHYSVFALIIFTLVGIAVLNIRRSAAGRRMVAVRGNERAAAAVGVNVARTKLYAFMLSALIAGIGGILIAFTNVVVAFGNPGGRFDSSFSINAIAQSTVGGIGFVSGPLVGTAMEPGAVMSKVLLFISSGSWFNLIGGLLLLLTVVTAPSGVAANFQAQFSNMGAKFRRKSASAGHKFTSEDVTIEKSVPTLLEIRNLGIAFGGNRVLQDVNVDIVSGQVLGIIGPNGAGKTTLVDAITGYNKPDQGSITMDGIKVLKLSPTQIARTGIARSFQSLELFEDLSVLDNLLVASDKSRWYNTLLAGVRPGKPALSEPAKAALASFGLGHRLNDAPSDLSYGERRLLAIARALASRPRVLLLDEPAAGLGSEERLELRSLVRAIAKDWGIAVLIIEHDVELVLGVSDKVMALDFGKVIAFGSPNEVRNNPAVISAYLGTDNHDEVTPVNGKASK